jgi:hypothetical protein
VDRLTSLQLWKIVEDSLDLELDDVQPFRGFVARGNPRPSAHACAHDDSSRTV